MRQGNDFCRSTQKPSFVDGNRCVDQFVSINFTVVDHVSRSVPKSVDQFLDHLVTWWKLLMMSAWKSWLHCSKKSCLYFTFKTSLNICQNKATLNICQNKATLNICQNRSTLNICQNKATLNICQNKATLLICQKKSNFEFKRLQSLKQTIKLRIHMHRRLFTRSLKTIRSSRKNGGNHGCIVFWKTFAN